MENTSRIPERSIETPGLSRREYLILFLLVSVPFAFSWHFYDRLPQQVASLMERGQLLGKNRHLALVLSLQCYLAAIYVYFLGVSCRAIFSRGVGRPAVWELSNQLYHVAHRLMAVVFYPYILLIGFIGPIELLRTADWDPSLVLHCLVWSIGLLNGVIIVASLVLLVRYRRLEKRLSALVGQAPASDPRERDSWRLPGLYINRDNPALWVEKRWGGGWTINLGHPQAKRECWRLLAVLFLPLLLIAVLAYL